MDVDEIIDSMMKHYIEYPYFFYRKIIDKLEKLEEKYIYDINNPYFLEAVRINISYHNEYHIYFNNENVLTYSSRKLYLSEYQLYNLFYQCFAIDDNNNYKNLCYDNKKNSKIESIIKKLKKDQKKFVMYVIFSKIKLDDYLYKTNKNYEIGGIVLGIDSLKFLQHQRIDRLCKLLFSNNPDIRKVMEIMVQYNYSLYKLNWIERERFVIFSGATLQALGTTYTRDVDILIIANKKDKSYIETINDILLNLDVDYSVLLNDGNWYSRNYVLSLTDLKIRPYQKIWFTFEFPMLSGAHDIFEMITNPKHFFFFMGMKFLSIESFIQRSKKRAFPESFVDLISMEKFNNIYLLKPICIPIMAINKGRVRIMYGEQLELFYKDIQKLLKLWHNKYLSIEKIKKKFKSCYDIEEPFEIYKGKIFVDEDTHPIKIFHIQIKRFLINKYCFNSNNLLDIGSGHLKDLEFWYEANIKHVIAIEPSKSSIKKAYKRLQKFKYPIDVNIINGVGDEYWKKNKKYDILYKNAPFNCITLYFTIHYMIDNLNILMQNIDSSSKKGTYVIILCMNGNYTFKKLLKHKGKIEIRNNLEPIFGVYSLEDLNKYESFKIVKVLVYFKGTYGVQAGSIEFIFDQNFIIDAFNKYHFSLVDKFPLLNIDLPEKNYLTKLQKKVSKFYMGLIFLKN